MLLNRTNLPRHLPWIVFAAAITVLAAAWTIVYGIAHPGESGGGTIPGITFGVAATVIIWFEFLLWPRKAVRAWRVGRAEAWLRAHIWLGLLTVPLILAHSAFRLGGPLSALLFAVFLMVIASGIFGLVLQQFLPSQMLDELPAETIYSQIDYLLARLRSEADQLIDAVCGSALRSEAEPLAAPAYADRAADRPITVGAVRRVGTVEGKVLQTVLPHEPLPDAEPLEVFYRGTVRPFLEPAGVKTSPLRSAKQAERMFRDLRVRLGSVAEEAVQALESLCEQRRQFDRQARLHLWLHSWLCVHLPFSVALVVLMMLHAWKAIEYW